MATQITATLPTLDFPQEVDYPTQEDWAAFSAAAELNFGLLGGSWSTQMQLWKTEANAMSNELNTNATIAQGLADYQGDWTSKGYTLGQTVSVSGIYYICKLTHATGQNPTTDGSLYWNLALGNWSLKVDTNMSGYTSKTTPVDDDLIPLSDSSASFGIKKLSWDNLKTILFGSPALTGTPTAPTQSAQDNSTKIATTAYVDEKMVLGTAIASTSGTSIDFTGIPSWAKRISILFKGVSTNGNSGLLVQIGNTTIQTTGYLSSASGFINGTLPSTYGSTSGFIVFNDNITDSNNIKMTIDLMSNFTYISTHNGITDDVRHVSKNGSGVVSLPSALDRIRITSGNGTETFDAGQINIMYEG